MNECGELRQILRPFKVRWLLCSFWRFSMIFLFLSECQCCDFHLRQMRRFPHVALPNLCRQQEIHASQWLYGTIYRFALHNLWWMRTCQMRRMLILWKNTCKSNKECPFFKQFKNLIWPLLIWRIFPLQSQESILFRAKMSSQYPMTVLVVLVEKA